MTALPMTPAPVDVLPGWANELRIKYASDATNQFILHGNIQDRFLLPLARPVFGSLTDFLLQVLLGRFDVILSYDVGNGVRVEKGSAIFAEWPWGKDNDIPKGPRGAAEALTHYFRYCANLTRLNRGKSQVALIVKSAQLMVPALLGGLSYDLSAIALLVREWNQDSALCEQPLATFLLTENLNDLHPLIVNNARAARIEIPLPGSADLTAAFKSFAPTFPTALTEYAGKEDLIAGQLVGATLASVESLLREKEFQKEKITGDDLVKLKKELVENDCNGLIEFIDSKKTLDNIYGQEKIKAHIRQDIALWKKGDLAALPMGYLIAGPVGTGKTFMVECIAGEAGVPVVKFKNFRDKWIGSTEGNLEKIFRILGALGRCFVFIDEADQALGKRDSDAGDGGVGGRVYGMFAEQMSKTENRGKVIWILASSRPDLIEVDLKRPGRIDVKIPLFPTTTAAEGFNLIRALAKRRGIMLPDSGLKELESLVPTLLTPGAAEALAVKLYRSIQTMPPPQDPVAVLKTILADYQSPVPPEVMKFQIDLAAREASDLEFVPTQFRPPRGTA